MIARWLTIPERWPGRTIAAIGLLFALTYGASLVVLAKPTGRIVIGDAVHYYVYLRSAVFDGDLKFRDEYVRIYGLRGGEEGTEWVHEPTATGHTRNLMSIGPAIVWAPLYLVVAAMAWLTHAIGGGATPDGYGRLFQASTGVSGVLAATLGVYLAYRAAAALAHAPMRAAPTISRNRATLSHAPDGALALGDVDSVSRSSDEQDGSTARVGTREAIWATLVMWLGSHAIYYSLISPTYSHAITMLTAGLFIVVWLTTRERQTIGRYALVGLLGGLAALVRWQDAVLLVIPAIEAAWLAIKPEAHASAASARWTSALVRLLACGAASIVAFLPQMLVWQVLYGSPFLVPQGDEFMRWTTPALGSVLFSDWHGLFTWTPIVVVAIAGLVVLARREAMVATALGVALLLSWYANAAVADWWAGEAYGARRFVSCFPIFVIGLAAAMRPLTARLRLLATLAAIVIVLNGLLLLQYQTFMHGLRTVAPYPRGAYELWLARFVVPIDLLRRWLS
jgi:hypothetical protein